MLPEFCNDGNLPSGEYSVSFNTLAERFGGPSPIRRRLTRALENLLPVLKGMALEIYIFGSYITRKPAPSDLDIFVILHEDWYHRDPTKASLLLDIRGNVSQHKLELWFAPEDDDRLLEHRFRTCAFNPDDPSKPKGYIRLEVYDDQE